MFIAAPLETPLGVEGYPRSIKSFYMRGNADGSTVAATDLLVPGTRRAVGSWSH